jgi:alpha-ribazole phosphatase
MQSYIIHLLRHGMTEGNQKGQYVGQIDLPVSTDGIKQLREFKDKYDYESPKLFFCSPLSRCSQTLKEIYGENIKTIPVEGLKECSFGKFEGKVAADLTDDPDFIDWVQNGKPAPGGEDNKAFAERVCNAFNDTVREILKAGVTESVICAHGGVIMTILAVYGIPRRQQLDWMTNNGRGFTIRVTPGIWMRTGMVEVLSEFPFGSNDEPDLSINPVKEKYSPWGNTDADLDEDDETADVMWADVD